MASARFVKPVTFDGFWFRNDASLLALNLAVNKQSILAVIKVTYLHSATTITARKTPTIYIIIIALKSVTHTPTYPFHPS